MKPQIKKYLLLFVAILVATVALYAQGNLQEKPNKKQEKAADAQPAEDKGESAMMDCCKKGANGESGMQDMMKMCHSMMSNMEMGEGMNSQHMEGMDMGQQEGTANTATTNVPVLNNYLAIKNALVKDNFDQAKQAATDFQRTLDGGNSKLSDAQKKELKGSAGKVAQAKDIASMREQFSALSQQLYQVVQASDLTDKTLYWQHCPMAMNNKGANWLSLEEKVQNPYMGQQMPRCGSVQKTIN